MVRIGKSDLEMMVLLAELRVASSEHLALATGANAEAIARRLLQLRDQAGYVQALAEEFGQGPGRPRRLFALAAPGARLLAQAGRLPPEQVAAVATPPAPGSQRHLLMANCLWVELRRLQRCVPFLNVISLASGSPLIQRTPDGKSVLQDLVALADGQVVGFEPDGAFSLRHLELNKTLLFLVEVDRGSEPLTSPTQRPAIARKLACYQRYSENEGYKRYENLFGAPLRGFRLLVVPDSAQRTNAICRLVQQSPPLEFVWIADHAAILAQGLAAPIWYAGGDRKLAAQSILGGQYQRVRELLDVGGRGPSPPPAGRNAAAG